MSSDAKIEHTTTPEKAVQTYHTLRTGQMVKAEGETGHLAERVAFAQKPSKYTPHIGKKHQAKIDARRGA